MVLFLLFRKEIPAITRDENYGVNKGLQQAKARKRSTTKITRKKSSCYDNLLVAKPIRKKSLCKGNQSATKPVCKISSCKRKQSVTKPSRKNSSPSEDQREIRRVSGGRPLLVFNVSKLCNWNLPKKSKRIFKIHSVFIDILKSTKNQVTNANQFWNKSTIDMSPDWNNIST